MSAASGNSLGGKDAALDGSGSFANVRFTLATPVAVLRQVIGKVRVEPFQRDGKTLYQVIVPWTIYLVDKTLNVIPVSGVKVSEQIKWGSSRDFVPKGAHYGNYTSRNGWVRDPWYLLPFSSLNGFVNVGQTLTIDGRTATWSNTVYSDSGGRVDHSAQWAPLE